MGKGIRQAGARSATRPVPSAVKAVDYKLYWNLCISLIVTACAIYYARDEGSAGTDGSLFKRGHGNAVSFSQPPSPGVTGATQHRGEKGASAPARRNVKQRGVRGRPRTLEDQRAALKQAQSDAQSARESTDFIGVADALKRGLHEVVDDTLRLELLSAAASAASTVRRHNEALGFYKEALHIKGKIGATVGNFLATYAEVATTQWRIGRYDDAVVTLQDAHAHLEANMSPIGLAILNRMLAHVHNCKGDYQAAVRYSDQAFQDDPNPDEIGERVRRLLHVIVRRRDRERRGRHLDEPGDGLGPDELRAAVFGVGGKWRDLMQLPLVTYVPELTAQPWHHRGQWQSYDYYFDLLESYHTRLQHEWSALVLKRKPFLDEDCIHEVHGSRGEWAEGAAPNTGDGQWMRFEVTGVLSDLDEDTLCSVHTPAACELLSEARANGPGAVLRLGYSAIGSGAWLRPHYGMSNNRLKFHLGLNVPKPVNCTWMRVGNETRSWSEGMALMFDDSFEHEVQNDCEDERVVFQLVVVHPEIPSDRRYKAVVIDGD